MPEKCVRATSEHCAGMSSVHTDRIYEAIKDVKRVNFSSCSFSLLFSLDCFMCHIKNLVTYTLWPKAMWTSKLI